MAEIDEPLRLLGKILKIYQDIWFSTKANLTCDRLIKIDGWIYSLYCCNKEENPNIKAILRHRISLEYQITEKLIKSAFRNKHLDQTNTIKIYKKVLKHFRILWII